MRRQIALAIVFAATAITLGAKTPVQHEWKTGTVQEQEHKKTPGDGFLVAPLSWDRLRICGDGYAFDVERQTPWHKPNVTINGPVKYALEPGGKFFISDDDGRVFEMRLQKKTLLPVNPDSGGN